MFLVIPRHPHFLVSPSCPFLPPGFYGLLSSPALTRSPHSPPLTVIKPDRARWPYLPIPNPGWHSRQTTSFPFFPCLGPALCWLHCTCSETRGRCAVYYPYKPAPFFPSLPFKRVFLFDWTRKGTLRGELTLSPLYCPINTCPVKGWVGSPEPWSMRTFNPSGKCKVALNTIKGQISIYSLPKPLPSRLMHRGCMRLLNSGLNESQPSFVATLRESVGDGWSDISKLTPRLLITCKTKTPTQTWWSNDDPSIFFF